MKSNSNLNNAIAKAVVDQADKKGAKKPTKKMPPAPMPLPPGGNAGMPTPPMGTDAV